MQSHRPPMHRRGFAVLAALVALFTLLLPGLAAAGEQLILRVGESKVIFLGKIKNVQVGNSAVIDVQKHPEGDKIIVFGVKPGYSSLAVGDIEYDVNVVGDVETLRKDVETLLLDIPGVAVLSSGEDVVVDGVVKRRDDFDRIQKIVAANKGRVYSLAILDERDIVKKAQIQLHFQVLEINRTKNHDIGVTWSSGPVRLVMDTISYVQFGVGNITDALGNVRTPDDLLKFDSTADVRRVLDKDFFTTISGEPVQFHRGKTLIFTTVGNLNGAAQVTFKERKVGLTVECTPVIDDDGDIDLTVDMEFATVGQLELGGQIPSINTQNHKTHVQLKEGESFALSGFFRRDKGRLIEGLPGLKDIPGLGVLFGTRSWMKGDTDGIVVITPVLLDPEGRAMRKQIKETLDIYDAADVKF